MSLKKKVFTCTPEYFTVFTSVYIKMCLCDQVYFVICWDGVNVRKCLFLLMRGSICAYIYTVYEVYKKVALINVTFCVVRY